jgi:DnaK suppressor protein
VDEANMKRFRSLLEERLKKLIAGQGAAIGQLTDVRDAFADAVDIASEESDREFTLRVHDHERHLVRQIQAALKRMDDGEYGECVACGEEISPGRLSARPMATHCIDCMTELEQRDVDPTPGNSFGGL